MEGSEKEGNEMTVTIESQKINGYYITIEIAKYATGFQVSAYPIQSEGICGYAITSLCYADLKKAKRRFSTLCKRAERNEL